MRRLSRSELEAALPLLDLIPDPALWIDADYLVRWRNRRARDDYGDGPGKCYQVAHGRQRPCDQEGETCPMRQAEISDAAADAVHVHSRRTPETEFYRVLAIPVENGGVLELHHHLGRVLLSDELTGLYRREYWREIVERDRALLMRLDRPYAVVFLDLDHFKVFNDAHGHIAGDELLRRVGKAVARQIRSSDAACRWGGEEIVLFLPNTSMDQAVQLAERIRVEVGRARVETSSGPQAVTASLGVHAAPARHSLEDSVSRADQALFAAKTQGRNRVCRSRGAPPAGGDAVAGAQ